MLVCMEEEIWEQFKIEKIKKKGTDTQAHRQQKESLRQILLFPKLLLVSFQRYF